MDNQRFSKTLPFDAAKVSILLAVQRLKHFKTALKCDFTIKL